MTDISSTGPLAGSGAYPKTAEELGKFVEKTVNDSIEKAVDKAVEKAVKSFEIAAQYRPQEAAERPASKTMPVFTGIIALAALATLQLGMFYWLDNSIRSEISSVNGEMSSLRGEMSSLRVELNAEISSVRGEISDLRSDMREDFRLLEAKFEAKFDEVWAELAELNERMARIEVVMQDRLPAAP